MSYVSRVGLNELSARMVVHVWDHKAVATEQLRHSSLRGGLKLKAAADYISVSAPTMYRLIARGLIKPNRSLRHIIIPIAELDRFLSN